MKIERPKASQEIPLHAKKVFSGILFDIYQWEEQMYDGSKRTFEKARRPDTVVVFGVLPDGKILLTKQEQPGKKAPFIGATGGRVDPGEDPLTAAKRELREESGYEAEEFILWDAQHPVGKVDWAVYTFIAKGLKKMGDMELDGGEKIQLLPLSFNEFINVPNRDDIFFAEREMINKLIEARLDPEKRKELEELFKP